MHEDQIVKLKWALSTYRKLYNIPNICISLTFTKAFSTTSAPPGKLLEMQNLRSYRVSTE